MSDYPVHFMLDRLSPSISFIAIFLPIRTCLNYLHYFGISFVRLIGFQVTPCTESMLSDSKASSGRPEYLLVHGRPIESVLDFDRKCEEIMFVQLHIANDWYQQANDIGFDS